MIKCAAAAAAAASFTSFPAAHERPRGLRERAVIQPANAASGLNGDPAAFSSERTVGGESVCFKPLFKQHKNESASARTQTRDSFLTSCRHCFPLITLAPLRISVSPLMSWDYSWLTGKQTKSHAAPSAEPSRAAATALRYVPGWFCPLAWGRLSLPESLRPRHGWTGPAWPYRCEGWSRSRQIPSSSGRDEAAGLRPPPANAAEGEDTGVFYCRSDKDAVKMDWIT